MDGKEGMSKENDCEKAIRLNEADWNAFVAALDDPTPPNAAMIELLREPWGGRRVAGK